MCHHLNHCSLVHDVLFFSWLLSSAFPLWFSGVYEFLYNYLLRSLLSFMVNKFVSFAKHGKFFIIIYLGIFSYIIDFLLSFLDTNNMNVRPFAIVPQVSESWFNFDNFCLPFRLEIFLLM